MSMPGDKPLLFESVVCSRCGGSGTHSFCTMYGNTCFKCRGRGRILTTKGAAAQIYLNSLYSKRADAFVPGDLIYIEGFSAGSFAVPTKFHKVTGQHVDKNNPGLIVIEHEGGTYGSTPDSLIRAGQSGPEKDAKRALALAYQSTLTKKGIPRKS